MPKKMQSIPTVKAEGSLLIPALVIRELQCNFVIQNDRYRICRGMSLTASRNAIRPCEWPWTASTLFRSGRELMYRLRVQLVGGITSGKPTREDD